MSDANENRFIADAGMGSISSVVATIPAGFNLGETRTVSSVRYRLLHNAGNSQISQGMVATPIGSAGPYSLTVSTATKVYANIGAAFVVHATVPTANYFWGAVEGRIGGVIGDVSSAATGAAIYIGSNGAVELMPQSVVTGNVVIGVNLGGAASKTVTTGALSGDVLIVGNLQ